MKRYVIYPFLLAALFFFTHQPCFAGKGRIGGSVKSATGEAIEGATIVATNPRSLPSQFETTTNEKGKWSMMGLQLGTWTFEISAEGFQPYQTSTRVMTVQRNKPIDVVLESLAEQAGGLVFEEFGKFAEWGEEAYALFSEEKYAESLAKFDQILAEAEAEGESEMLSGLYLNIGKCQLKLEDYDQAIAAYEKVLAADPGSIAALQDIGECYVMKKDFDKAKQYLEKWIEMDPMSSTVYYNVAEVFFRSNDVEKAEEYYITALELQPGWAKVHLKLGYVYLNLGNDPKAIENFEKFIALAPDDPQAGSLQNTINYLKSQAKE